MQARRGLVGLYTSVSRSCTAFPSQSATLATLAPISAERKGYSAVRESDLSYFRSVLGDARVLQNENMEKFNRDWMGRFIGRSNLALRPNTTDQVAQILKHCNERRIAVVPQAGNSGLSGGSVPVSDEVVLLTSDLNKVLAFDQNVGTLTCQSGCTLSFLSKYMDERGFTIPLDLGAPESQAGGWLSTNAGGLRFVRFGSLRGSVLGIEAVLPNGTILDLLHPLRKDNTGYDLKQLFIGGEGTLGIITAVSLLCPTKSASISTTCLACGSFQDLQKVLILARQHMNEILSAFEFFDKQALDFTLSVLPEVKAPLQSSSHPFYAIIETAGSNRQHNEEKLKGFMLAAKSAGLLHEAKLASNEQETDALWYLRKNISVALSTKGPVYKYDLSLPLDAMYGLVKDMRERLSQTDAEVVAYGHMGDGNLHLNISVPSYDEKILGLTEPFVYEYTNKHRGSISAEHGLGQMKKDYVGYTKPAEAIAVMRQLKELFDPNGILNPFKFLPEDRAGQPKSDRSLEQHA